jgi:CheY-like chemotaxis protein
VRDTGIGIPAGNVGILFNSFTQVDASRTRRYGGSGLGLAICRGLTELMGGSIRVESAEGAGSTFTFTLPLKMEERRPKQAPTTGRQPVRILLAEDEPMVRQLVQLVLGKRGWEIVAAINGCEAVALWEAGGIDLVLMDMQMPVMDGLAATRQIRAQEVGGCRTPILALTAHARREDRQECQAAGMDGFLTKPINIKQLYATIEEFLRQPVESPS